MNEEETLKGYCEEEDESVDIPQTTEDLDKLNGIKSDEE